MTMVQANISALYSKLNEFRVNDKYCDITIRVDGESFKCHRLILAATCDYLDVLLSPEKFEKGKTESITLENIDAAAFAEVLMFAYTGKVTVTAENAFSLIEASEYLGLSFIEELCIEYIQQKIAIPIKNIVHILSFARLHMKHSLTKIISEYIITNFHTVSEADEFLDLTFEDFRSLLDQYQDRVFPSLNNELLLNTILRWVRHSRPERMLHFSELINTVGFEKISPGYTKFIVEKLFTDATISSNDLIEYTSRNAESLHVFIELRFNDSRKLSIFSLTDHDNTYKWRYSCTLPNDGDMQLCANGNNRPTNIYTIRNVPLDNFLYSLNFDERRKNAQKFYAASSITLADTFYTLKSPPVIVSRFEMCTLRNNIYLYNRNIFQPYTASTHNIVPDLLNNEELARGFYRYDPTTDKWFSVAPLKKMASQACLTADNNSLYMVGGLTIDRRSSFQAYDSRTSQWRELPECTNNYYENGACCAHEGKIFVSGGCGSRRTGVFDLVAGKWQYTSLMNKERYLHRLVSLKGRVWAIGDHSGDLTIEIYDPMGQEWCYISALQKAVNSCIDKQEIDWLVTAGVSRNNSDKVLKFIYDGVVFKPLDFSLE